MTRNVNPSVTPSAAAHAERIRAGEESAESERPVAGQSTAEMIASRILPGYRADAELRERARMNELRARGVIAAETDEPEDEDDEDLVEVEDVEEEDVPLTTAEKYAAVERKRQQAEHAATLAAHRGAVKTLR